MAMGRTNQLLDRQDHTRPTHRQRPGLQPKKPFEPAIPSSTSRNGESAITVIVVAPQFAPLDRRYNIESAFPLIEQHDGISFGSSSGACTPKPKACISDTGLSIWAEQTPRDGHPRGFRCTLMGRYFTHVVDPAADLEAPARLTVSPNVQHFDHR
jgi:hypothetical protein